MIKKSKHPKPTVSLIDGKIEATTSFISWVIKFDIPFLEGTTFQGYYRLLNQKGIHLFNSRSETRRAIKDLKKIYPSTKFQPVQVRVKLDELQP